MYFNLEERLLELEKKFTKKSIEEFLERDWAKVKYPNDNSWYGFIRCSEHLVPIEKEEEDVVYLFKGLPMPTHKLYSIYDYLGQNRSQEERTEFECSLAYLYHFKKIPFSKIKEAIEKLMPLGDRFLPKFKSAKSLNTEEARTTIKKIIDEYNQCDI